MKFISFLLISFSLYAQSSNPYILGAKEQAGAAACTDVVDSFQVANTWSTLIFRSANGKHEIAFRFNSGAGGTICQVQAAFHDRVGTGGTMHAIIVADSSVATYPAFGSQQGGASDTENFTDITTGDETSPTDISFDWSADKPSLTASTWYWVIIQPNWTLTTSSYARGTIRSGLASTYYVRTWNRSTPAWSAGASEQSMRMVVYYEE